MIGDVGYGKSFDQLVTLKEHPAVRPIHEHLAEFGVIQNVPWLLHLLDCIPGAAESFAATERFCQDQRRRKQEVSWLGFSFRPFLDTRVASPIIVGVSGKKSNSSFVTMLK